MLTIATVQVGNYCGRGRDYVSKFYAGVRCNLNAEWRGVCFTDDPDTVPKGIEAREVDPDLKGWWAKLFAFKPGTFEDGERILYSDLDVLPVGDLSDIAGYDGEFAAWRDPYFPAHMNSSLMSWKSGELDHVWTAWDIGGRPQFDPRGDQFWIETVQPKADYWQDIVLGQVVSFKADCWPKMKVPDGTRVICFHGRPRLHECPVRSIKEIWNERN